MNLTLYRKWFTDISTTGVLFIDDAFFCYTLEDAVREQKIYGKTGYTRAAQSCFVGYLMKGNDVCIIAVFGCTRRWEDIKHIVERYGGIDL